MSQCILVLHLLPQTRKCRGEWVFFSSPRQFNKECPQTSKSLQDLGGDFGWLLFSLNQFLGMKRADGYRQI